jgi:aryl-alcohol dehydrogenase-like predicted oxidoreductase
VSTAITGASRPHRVTENMNALGVVPLLDAAAVACIGAALTAA